LRVTHTSGRVVLVSHGVAIHHMVTFLLGMVDAGVIFSTDNCAVHHFELRERNVKVVSLNDTRHLAGI
jgi:broad specificity phosphatase PhoE